MEKKWNIISPSYKSLKVVHTFVSRILSLLFNKYDQLRETYMWSFFENEFQVAERERVEQCCKIDPYYSFYPRLDFDIWKQRKDLLFPSVEWRKPLGTGNDSTFFSNNKGKYAKIYRPCMLNELKAYYDFMSDFGSYCKQNLIDLSQKYNTNFLYSNELSLSQEIINILKIQDCEITDIVVAKPTTIQQCLQSRLNYWNDVSKKDDVCVVYGDYIGEWFETITAQEEKIARFIYYALTQYINFRYPDKLDKLRYLRGVWWYVYNPLIEPKHINIDHGTLTILDISNIILMIKILDLWNKNE